MSSSSNIINNQLKQIVANEGINNLSDLHVIAYDMGKMIGQALGKHYSQEAFLQNINSSKPFDGYSGSINFIDSIAYRKYDIITKKHNKYSVSN
jgi:hypothetical protein